MDVVRAEFPDAPTTQPLGVPLELNQAARLVLKDPIFLSKASGDLWITRDDAPPTIKVLKQLLNPPDGDDTQTRVVRDSVQFVHWLSTDSGNLIPYLVCRRNDGASELVSVDGRKRLPARRAFEWGRAFSWDGNIVVPSAGGISVIQVRPELTESYHALEPGPTTQPSTRPAGISPTLALPDGEGLLAWAPWTRTSPGSRGAARFVDGRWTDLGSKQGWPEKIVHLVPLRDGTVFQFVAQDDAVAVETAALDHTDVDSQAIEKLVGQLSDADPDIRRSAMKELANFGPGAWPVLDRLAGDQPPQAKVLLKQLLKDKNRPTLSGLTLVGDRLLQLANRLSDGGAVFYAPQGVTVPNADGDPDLTAPAWLSVRPGHYVELLPPNLTADLKPDSCHLDVVGDQWIVNTDIRGPRLFYGNGFANLLRKSERSFTQVVGMDQRGRWLFRNAGSPEPTLVIDPHLPDLTPRLPVWNLAIADTVGWDRNGWPIVKSGVAYALTESDWRQVNDDEKWFTRPDQMPPATQPSTTRPTTRPGLGTPLLVTADGTQYFGGITDLTLVQPDGKEINWPLPPIDQGSPTAHVSLILAKTGKLFLFNQPGRVLRIARTPHGPEPFKVEATFTHNIPSVPHPTRIWLDPAGRIDIAWDNRLALLFPEGYLPRGISDKMVDQGLDPDQ